VRQVDFDFRRKRGLAAGLREFANECVQRMLVCSVGSPTEGEDQNAVACDTSVEETKRMKLTDKAIGKNGERAIGP
jgi:hypothetical protein